MSSYPDTDIDPTKDGEQNISTNSRVWFISEMEILVLNIDIQSECLL